MPVSKKTRARQKESSRKSKTARSLKHTSSLTKEASRSNAIIANFVGSASRLRTAEKMGASKGFQDRVNSKLLKEAKTRMAKARRQAALSKRTASLARGLRRSKNTGSK